jgi:tripartite-type tricarboxylate transporter receptor subunit TctC
MPVRGCIVASRALVVPALAVLALAVAAPHGASAQSWPTQPVTLVSPFPPGGSVDITARIISEPLAKAIGGTVVVENRSGASGNIGMEAVSKARPDGYTLGINTVSLATNPSLFPKMPFDTMRDFVMIGPIAKSQHILLVHPSVQAKNVKELVAMAKSRPGKLNYASAGGGSTFHIAAELFKDRTGTFILHIPYRGGGPALADMLGGQVDMGFPVISAGLPHVKAGKLRALAVTSTKRSELLPDVPTMQEAGVKDYEFSTWFVVVAPAKTPRDVVLKVNQALAQVVRSPAMTERFAKEGFEAFVASPEETAAFVQGEMNRYAKLIKERGITAE